MNQHPYLRAYMAGIVVPTIVLLFGLTSFTVARYVYNVPLPIERLIVFPMAVVPNLWGVWNILFVASRSRTHLSLGIHGMLLPLVLVPLGLLLIRALDFPIPFAAAILPVGVPLALIVYYLVWKYVVASLNRILGLA
ncbi:MAG: hypothetical protein WA715_26975 [Candidatus Acidiferrum sp.]